MIKRIAIGVGLVAALACSRTEAKAPSPAPAEPLRAAPSAPPANSNPPPAPAAGAAAAAPLAPLEKGKRVRIAHLAGIAPLEVTLPPGVKMEKRHMNGEGIAPRAGLVGGVLNIEVMEPEAGFRELKWYKEQLSSDEKLIRAEETPDGFLWMDALRDEFSVLVSRPKLKVICAQSQLKSLADAETAASICLSLRPAK